MHRVLSLLKCLCIPKTNMCTQSSHYSYCIYWEAETDQVSAVLQTLEITHGRVDGR